MFFYEFLFGEDLHGVMGVVFCVVGQFYNRVSAVAEGFIAEFVLV